MQRGSFSEKKKKKKKKPILSFIHKLGKFTRALQPAKPAPAAELTDLNKKNRDMPYIHTYMLHREKKKQDPISFLGAEETEFISTFSRLGDLW